MPRNITVTFEDGSQHVYNNAPDSVTPDQITARARKDFGKSVTALDGGRKAAAQPAAPTAPPTAPPQEGEQPPQQRSTLRELGRQLGLTARYAIEGVPQTADMVAAPFRVGLNKLNGLMGGDPEYFRPVTEQASSFADTLGLPQPEGKMERIVGDATRSVAGAAGGIGAAGAVAKTATGATTKAVAGKMAAGPGTQAVSAATGGSAGSAVKENGGTPGGQFIATLVGGLAGPAPMGAARSTANAAGAAARKALDPGKVDQVLKQELTRAGIDWDNIGAAAKIQMRKDAEKAIYSDQPLNADALRRLAEFRVVGATPMMGDITQDPGLLTLQRNLAKSQANSTTPGELPGLQNANATRVIETLRGQSSSPLDAFATGERLIGAVQSKDAALKAGEKALYDQARGAAGRDIPLDRSQFVNDAFQNLAATNRQAFLPESVGKVLDQIAAGTVKVGGKDHAVPFDVATIDQFKTILASASRATADGNAKAAISAVRDALENVRPAAASGGAQQPAAALKLFDQARSAARERRTWQESAKFVEAALDGAAPDQFVQKHVISSPVRELQQMRAELGSKQPEAVEAVRKQLVDYIMQRGRVDADTTKFSSAGMQDALRQLGERKLALFFSPDEIQSIRAAVNVGKYMQSQPIGSAVNNSNTGAMIWGRLSDMLGHASGLPVAGPMVAGPLQNAASSMQVRSLRDLSAGLTQPRVAGPGAVSGSAMPLSLLAAQPAQGSEDQKRRKAAQQ